MKQILSKKFGDNPAIVIDLDNRDSEGHPQITIFNKQFKTTGDNVIHLAFIEGNDTYIAKLMTTLVSRTVTYRKEVSNYRRY